MVLENKYDEKIDSAFSSYVSHFGNINEGFVDEEKTIRPIITLSKNTQVTGDEHLTNITYYQNNYHKI